MKYTWANDKEGLVQISKDGEAYEIPTIHSKNPNYSDYVRALRYLPLVKRYCGRMPEAWPIGIIFAENSKERDVSYAGAVGVMQVLPSSSGMTTMQLMHVEKNIEAGCKILRRLSSYQGADLVSVASMYNAGSDNNGRPHQSSESPFGFAEAHGYIIRVLSASNEFTLRAINVD